MRPSKSWCLCSRRLGAGRDLCTMYYLCRRVASGCQIVAIVAIIGYRADGCEQRGEMRGVRRLGGSRTRYQTDRTTM
eukprot:scaffold36661_cov60-Cyclotella_meneghiniana.AAC.3